MKQIWNEMCLCCRYGVLFLENDVDFRVFYMLPFELWCIKLNELRSYVLTSNSEKCLIFILHWFFVTNCKITNCKVDMASFVFSSTLLKIENEEQCIWLTDEHYNWKYTCKSSSLRYSMHVFTQIMYLLYIASETYCAIILIY